MEERNAGGGEGGRSGVENRRWRICGGCSEHYESVLASRSLAGAVLVRARPWTMRRPHLRVPSSPRRPLVTPRGRAMQSSHAPPAPPKQTDFRRRTVLPSTQRNAAQQGAGSTSHGGLDLASDDYLDRVEEELNRRVDHDTQSLVDGMRDLVALAKVSECMHAPPSLRLVFGKSSPSPFSPSLSSLCLPRSSANLLCWSHADSCIRHALTPPPHALTSRSTPPTHRTRPQQPTAPSRRNSRQSTCSARPSPSSPSRTPSSSCTSSATVTRATPRARNARTSSSTTLRASKPVQGSSRASKPCQRVLCRCRAPWEHGAVLTW